MDRERKQEEKEDNLFAKILLKPYTDLHPNFYKGVRRNWENPFR